MKISDEDLKRVNERRRGTEYSDKDAAKARYGKTLKDDLTSSPFVIEFEYGINADGYWNYDAMTIQMEDCIDVFKTLFDEEGIDCLFWFDHSSGHDRKRPDGLNISSMRKTFGGKQPAKRETILV